MIGEPAMKIKDSIPNHPLVFYNDLIKQIKKMLDAGLIHGDLSKFNVLNDNEKAVLIDFSQGMPKNSLRAKEYFERDLKNVNVFFKKIGVKEEDLKTLQDFTKKEIKN